MPIGHILITYLITSIQKKITSQKENPKQKKFWSFIMRKDSSGLASPPLRSDGDTFTDAPDKAAILNRPNQFSLLFT